MEAVKAFNEELSGIYETKPPISRAKMTMLTKKAIKGIKFYKHIVQSMEKFVQKCRPEYKVPGLYVIDSVVRQSRHQFGPEKDVFMPRLCKNIITTFQNIYKCPPEDKSRVLRVLNLWQKNSVFPQDIVQQLTMMGGASTLDLPQTSSTGAAATAETAQSKVPTDQADLTNLLANLLSNPDASKIQNLAGLLSSSQQNQLEDLLKQVKGSEQSNHKEPSPPPPQATIMPSTNIYQPVDTNQPRFSNQVTDVEPKKQPTFNREVLDFDYSDDEPTPPAKVAKQSHSIDPNLLASLPTPDQIQQLTAGRSGIPSTMNPVLEHRQRLEQEQEIFTKQIQEIEERSKKSESVSRNNGDETYKRKRTRSRSRSRDRHHRHHRKRSHSRDRHRSRRSRSRDRSRKSRRSRSKSHERRREKKGFPPVKEGFVSVCTTTLWIGNITSKVMQHELQALVEEYGKVESINMIPPRGCAYVCMKDRQEADRALHKIKHYRLGGKSLKCDWAPSKEMPEEQKETWVKDLGVNYVELTSDPTLLRNLSVWGCVDLDSVPEHRQDELKPPETEPEAEAKSTPPPPPQAQMIQSFSPAGVVPGGPGMVSRPGMPVMMRPFQLNPYGMQQRMNLSQPAPVPERPAIVSLPSTTALPPTPATDTSIDMKLDSPDSKTPTADEQTDEPAPTQQMQIQPQPMAQFPRQFAPVSIAQRYAAPVPVQLQMMPNVGPQVMQARMGMMPLRMGVPMQLRPGFHPAMQRMPMHGPQVMQNQPMRPPMGQQPVMQPQPGGYQQNMRMGMPGQPHLRMMHRPNVPPSQPRPPLERRPSTPPNDDLERDNEPPTRDFSNSPPPERRGFHDGPRPERPQLQINRMPMQRPGEFNRPRFDGSQNRMMRPPYMGRPGMPMMRPPFNVNNSDINQRPRPPRDFNRPDRPPLHNVPRPPHKLNQPREINPHELNYPRELDHPPRDMERRPPDMDHPPRDMERRPPDMERPPRDMERPPRDMERPPRDMERPPRDMERPSRDMERPPRDMERPPRDMERPPRDIDRPPRDIDRPPRDIDRPPRDIDRPPRDTDRPARDTDRPPRDTDRPPRDTDRPPRDTDRPPRDTDRPPRDIDRPPRDMDRPPRDNDRSSREDRDGSGRDRRDFDRGRRDRSRDRDRRDRDGDRRGRDRDFDRDRRRDRDIDRRDRDRASRDRRDRGSHGGRGFRSRDDRGRGRGGGRGWGGGGRGRGGNGGRRSPIPDPEDEEYQRKRQETLRKRHEEDDEYVVEKIDFTAFGLPSGFGGSLSVANAGDSSKDDCKDRSPSRTERPKQDPDRNSLKGSPEPQREYVEEKSLMNKVSDATHKISSPPVGDASPAEGDNALKTKAKVESSEVDQAEEKRDKTAANAQVENVVENGNIALSISETTKKQESSPGAGLPTNDEHENEVIEEEEIVEPDTKEQTDHEVEAT